LLAEQPVQALRVAATQIAHGSHAERTKITRNTGTDAWQKLEFVFHRGDPTSWFP
jgi:hypothetical protein